MASITEMQVESKEKRLKRNLIIGGIASVVSFILSLEIFFWFSVHLYHWSLFVAWNLWTLGSIWFLASIVGFVAVCTIASDL